MRSTISGMVAAVAVMMTMGAAPAMACYASACAPAPVYVSPAPVYSGCGGCGGYGGWATERLPDPLQQYYYVNQGPTYTGPGNWAPRPVYQETSVSYGNPYYGGGYRARPYYGARYGVGYGAGYRYGVRPALRYGYGARYGYGPRVGYGARVGHYGVRHGAYHGAYHGAARVGGRHRY